VNSKWQIEKRRYRKLKRQLALDLEGLKEEASHPTKKVRKCIRTRI